MISESSEQNSDVFFGEGGDLEISRVTLRSICSRSILKFILPTPENPFYPLLNYFINSYTVG